jgi:hypothetical protein
MQNWELLGRTRKFFEKGSPKFTALIVTNLHVRFQQKSYVILISPICCILVWVGAGKRAIQSGRVPKISVADGNLLQPVNVQFHLRTQLLTVCSPVYFAKTPGEAESNRNWEYFPGTTLT